MGTSPVAVIVLATWHYSSALLPTKGSLGVWSAPLTKFTSFRRGWILYQTLNTDAGVNLLETYSGLG